MQWEHEPERLGLKHNRVLGGGKRASEWVNRRRDERLRGTVRLSVVATGLASGLASSDCAGRGGWRCAAGVVVVEWLALEGWVMLPLEVWVVLAAWDLARAAHAGTQLSNELSHYWTDGPYLLSKPPEEEEAKMVQVYCMRDCRRIADVLGCYPLSVPEVSWLCVLPAAAWLAAKNHTNTRDI